MLLAASTREGGRRVLIVGLQRENVERLLNDMPIEKDLGVEGVPGLEGWTLYVLGPEDTARFVAQLPDASV
jgi:hypothetical protein